MKLIRIFVALACCILLLELGLMVEATAAKLKAHRLLSVVDHFALGTTSKSEVEAQLLHLGLTPHDEACSASVGSCQGIGVELANYPEALGSATAPILESVAAKISVFRPTYLVGNFYFYSGRLGSATVTFSTDQASIATTLASVQSGQDPTSEWRRSNRTGNATFVRILDLAHQQGSSLRAADIFDLGCMQSFRGCNTALELWPSMPQYKANH